MKDIVLISSYKEYLRELVRRVQEESKITQEAWSKAKEKYDNGHGKLAYIAKFLGWNFENSMHYFPPDRPNEWAQSYQGRLRDIDAEVNRLLYKSKMNETRCEFNTEYFNLRDFYKFCHENNLP